MNRYHRWRSDARGDQWCIKYARKKGLPVVDLTDFAAIIHQLHDYCHVAGGRQWVYGGIEADENLKYYGERGVRGEKSSLGSVCA